MMERFEIRCSHCGQAILALIPDRRIEPKYPGGNETLAVKEKTLELGQKPCPRSPDGHHVPAYN